MTESPGITETDRAETMTGSPTDADRFIVMEEETTEIKD